MSATEESSPKNKTTALVKRIAKIAFAVLAVFVVAIGIAFGYLYTHQSKIKQVITENLNQQLNTKVSVGEIEIDFFSKFPEVSIKFTNVRADEALPQSEQSLFLFTGIFVRFSIWDLLGEDYTVRKLSFDDGEVNLRVTPDGKVNYIFWKEADSASGTATSIDLDNIEINNAKLRYLDEAMDLRVIVYIKHLDVSGGYKNQIFTSELLGEGILADLTYEDYDLADSLDLKTSGTLATQGGTTKISIEKLLVQNVELNGTGEVRDNFQRWRIASQNTNLRQWLPIIPATWRPTIDPATLGGNADAVFDILLDGKTTEVVAKSTLKDASLTLAAHNILLQNAGGNFVFRYADSGKKSVTHLSVTNMQAKTRTGVVKLALEIDDLLAPNVAANIGFNVQLEELLTIARPGLLKEARGSVSGTMSYKQRFASWDDLQEQAFLAPQISGDLAMQHGEMTFMNSNIKLREISAEVQLRNKDLVIERLFLREGESEFLLDGWFYNALYFGINRPVPMLSIRLQSNFVDLNRIMAWSLPRKNEDESEYTTDRTAPPAFNYNVALDVKRFDLIRFTGQNLKGEIWNEGLKIKGKNLVLDALNGKVAGSFVWSTEADAYRFWTKGDLTRIDINQLFSSFENFGQEWLLADNIFGTGTASIETSMDFDLKMNMVPATFKLISNISIEKGRLKGYKPLMSLSSIVEKKALEDVSFDKLENQIAIANEVITIPQMEIKSSALNLLLLGRHSFDQQIDYSVRLALKDVINKKRKDKKTDLDAWIVEVETTDQPYIWVHIGCTIDNPCLSLDREILKKGVKEEWKQQGEDIRNIFKPDTRTEPKQDPTKGEVLFEWNEEEPDTNKRL